MNTDVMFSKQSDEWLTPPSLYKFLDEYFHFELDPCATEDNSLKTERFYTKKDDGLNRYWGNASTFINPPYSQISKWIDKSINEFDRRCSEFISNLSHRLCPIVLLVPARVDTKWFHRVCGVTHVKVVFLQGRVKFVGAANSAPFPSCLIIFAQDRDPQQPILEEIDCKPICCYKLNPIK